MLKPPKHSAETKCLWCRKTFVRAGAFSNHVRREHPDLLETMGALHEASTSDSTQSTNSNCRKFSNLPLYKPPDKLNDDDFEELPLYNDPSADTTDPSADIEMDIEDQNGGATEASLTTPDLTIVRHQRYETENQPSWNPLSPFSNALEYKLARFSIEVRSSSSRLVLMNMLDSLLTSKSLSLELTSSSHRLSPRRH